MCLIIASETGALPEESILRDAFRTNRDSWGIAYATKNGLVINKGFHYRAMRRTLKRAKGCPYVLHFRWATHGVIDLENAHPFEVTPDCYMAHNGVINNIAIRDKAHSDTWHFVEDFLKPLVGEDPTLLSNPAFGTMVGAAVGAYNKLAFICSDGRIIRSNEFIAHEGIWYSNDNHLPVDEDLYVPSWVRYCKETDRRIDNWDKFLDDPYDLPDGTIESDSEFECEFCNLSYTGTTHVYHGALLCSDCYWTELMWERENKGALYAKTN